MVTTLLTGSKVFPTWPPTTMGTMVTIFQNGRFCLVMHGKYDRLFLLSGLTLLSTAMMHDPNPFKNPMVYDPERYLKDGKLNPDVLDSSDVAFGFGRRWVD